MAILNQSAAARAAGVSRSTIVRFIKTGKLSATRSEAGERCVDTAELIRVFGSLKRGDSVEHTALIGQTSVSPDPLIQVLQEQLRLALEREQQSRDERNRLLTMLEVEQTARRDLEQKLLAGPKKKGKK